MVGNLCEQQLLIQVVADICPSQNGLPNPMPDLINSCLDFPYKIPIYIIYIYIYIYIYISTRCCLIYSVNSMHRPQLRAITHVSFCTGKLIKHKP